MIQETNGATQIVYTLREQIATPLHPATRIATQALASSSTASAASRLTVERIYESPSLNGPTPKRLTISPDGRRLLYLKPKEDNQKELSLWEYDLITFVKRQLVNAKTLLTQEEALSEQEKSQRERKRLFESGIVDYQWSSDGQAIVFSLGGQQYLLNVTSQEAKPIPLSISPGSNPLDVKISSHNNYVSFVRDQNLYIYDLRNHQESQLTTDGSETISNGIAEFIAQEELGRCEGYWWSPDEKKIAYVQVDESPVQIVERSEIGTDGTLKITRQRYPFAGSSNVTFKVGIFDIETRTTIWLDLSDYVGGYLARVNWLKDSSSIALQMLSRDQKTLDLVFADAVSKKSFLVLTEHSETWINVHNDLHFVTDGFIWSSERTGIRQLYLCDLNGILIRSLTSGEWPVNRVVGANDEKVYYERSFQNLLNQNLYCASLDPKGIIEPERITQKTGWHQINMDASCTKFIDTYSDVGTPPQVSLHTVNGELTLNGNHTLYLEKNSLDQNHPYYPYLDNRSIPEFGTIKAGDGQHLNYQMLCPASFDATKKYPVIVITYGGPGFRLVKNVWGSDPQSHWAQSMTHQGYVVFTLDNRGSSDRGTAFEKPIYGRLGNVEIEDQKAGVKFLIEKPYIDKERIGVFGWSYGGYMTLMTMFKAWEIFKVGVAVAPVTEWEQYDTCYTERYLGTPQENPSGYKESSVFTYVHNNIGKLLVIHGMSDDNVPCTHTIKLTHKMIEELVPFDELLYPGGKHSISETASRIHLFNKITDYFNSHLK